MSPSPSPVLPKGLQPGGTIAFISPSARLNESFAEPMARAKAALEAQGFRVKVFWTSRDPKTITIGEHITHCKDEILAAFADPTVDAIMCTIGGTTAVELIPAFLHEPAAIEVLRKNPKVFVGYSDITFLHWLLYKVTGLRTFYGPTSIPELGEFPKPMEFTMDNLCRSICHDGVADPKPLGIVPRSKEYAPILPDFFFSEPSSTKPSTYTPSPAWRWVRGGSATGRIFGGCLNIVVRLQGIAALVPDWTGRVLFLETAMADADAKEGYPMSRIRQNLGDLVAGGVMDNISGLVFGRFVGYNSQQAQDELENVIRGMVSENEGVRNDKPFPILMNVDFGHTSPMITIPIDAMVSLDSEKDEFSVLEAGIC